MSRDKLWQRPGGDGRASQLRELRLIVSPRTPLRLHTDKRRQPGERRTMNK
jgi:hypothetical protein